MLIPYTCKIKKFKTFFSFQTTNICFINKIFFKKKKRKKINFFLKFFSNCIFLKKIQNFTIKNKKNFFKNSFQKKKNSKLQGENSRRKINNFPPFFLKNQQQKIFFSDFKKFREIFIQNSKRNNFKKKEFRISFLPFWILSFFELKKKLNYIQTKIFPFAFGTNLNLLVVSPTGTGKTIIAAICILRIILNSINFENFNGKIFKKYVKILYIAPLKSLVKEIIKNLKRSFIFFNLKFYEITGERKVVFSEISSSNILIGTPEKISLFFKKQNLKNFHSQFKLLIVDEIHLLKEKRGIFLEQILMEFLMRKNMDFFRILGISATIPNFFDLGRFLNIDPFKGLFYFGNIFREVSLNQTIIGCKKLLSIQKNFDILNEILVTKISQLMEKKKGSKILIFVQSRRDTVKTGLFLLKKKEKNLKIIANKEEKFSINDFIKNKIGIHHAGLSKKNKNSIENFFRKGKIDILISTSTLAWGINLPVTNVIIKGTKVYCPETSSWKEISDLNIIQMLGRAGRDPAVQQSEAILITSFKKLTHYISLLNYQLPIESALFNFLPDFFNEECVKKKISTLCSAFKWFSKTFFCVRFYRNILSQKKILKKKEKNLKIKEIENKFIFQVIKELKSAGMLKLNFKKKTFSSTEIGMIASFYSINHQTVIILLIKLRPNCTIWEIIHILTLISEFSFFKIKKNEKYEISRLSKFVFFPIKEKISNVSFKINTLFQSFIGNIRIFSLSLIADSIFIAKTSIRILRALLEIGIFKRWASFSFVCFELIKSIRNQTWPGKFPFRLFFQNPSDDRFVKFFEKKNIQLKVLKNFPDNQLKKIFKSKKALSLIRKAKKSLPLIEAKIYLQPITRKTLKINITIHLIPGEDVNFSTKYEGFWIFLEDQFTDTLISYKYFLMKEKKIKIIFFVPIFANPISPYYFIRIKNFEIPFNCFEEAIDLTEIRLPLNSPMVTSSCGFKQVSFSRILSGIKSGLPLIEYFETHHLKIFGFFYQLTTVILKSSQTKILSSPQQKIKLIFQEISLFSFTNKTKKQIFFFFPSGSESIALKKIQLKNGSLGILGISIQRLTEKILIKTNKKNLKNLFLLLSYTEWFSFKKYIYQKFFGNLVFSSQNLHLLSDNNFGNNIESFFQNFFDRPKKKQEKKLIVSLFPILNLKELLEWVGFKKTPIFSFDKIEKKVKRKVTFFSKNNNNFDSEFSFRISLNRKLEEEEISKKKSRTFFLVQKMSSLKIKFFEILFGSNFFLSFFIPHRSLIFQKNFVKAKNFYRILKLFVGFKIGFFSKLCHFKKRRLIEEFCGSNFLNLLINNYENLGFTDYQKLNGKELITEKSFFEEKNFNVFFREIFFLFERFKKFHFFSKIFSLSIEKIFSSIFPTESVFLLSKNDNFLRFLAEKNPIKSKKSKKFWFLTFFSKRLNHNPQFYGYKTSLNFDKIIKKIIIKSKNEYSNFYLVSKEKTKFSKQLFLIATSYYQFSAKTIRILNFVLKKQNFFRILNTFITKLNSLHFIKIFFKFSYSSKKSFFNFYFVNRLKKIFFKNKQTNYFCFSFKQELKKIITCGVFFLSEKSDLKNVLFFSELNQILNSKTWKSNSELLLYDFNHFTTYLLGKIHKIFSIKMFFKKIFFSEKNHKVQKKFLKKKFFIKPYFFFSVFLKSFLKKKKKFNIVYFKINLWKKNIDIFRLFYDMHKELNFSEKNFIWWFIIGNITKNNIFFFKKIIFSKRKILNLVLSFQKEKFNLKIFMINETFSMFDKETNLFFSN